MNGRLSLIGITFLEYARYGVPATLFSLALGLVVLLAEHALFPGVLGPLR